MKKKECTKKLLAAFLCAAVTLTAVPIPAMAAFDRSAAEEKLRNDSSDFVIKNGVLTKYQGQDKDVTIPDGVTSIGSYAFSGCNSLTSITIPDGVTSIGNYAFGECSGLTSVTISNGVKSIGEGAFSVCSSLTSVTIPDGVTSIGSYAFRECSSLTSVTIPKGVTSIGDFAFGQCSSLTSVTIPDGVTSIGEHAFDRCSSLTSVTIPKSVTSIPSTAFSSCKKLATIYGATNSEAEAYATEHGVSFISTDPPAAKPSISNADVTIKSYTCTGKAIKPTTGIVVKLNGKTLVYGRDYKVTKYTNNTNPGTASVIIAGIGNYSGTKTKTFKINLATPGSAKQSARTTTSIKLSWSKVPGATSYVVERAPYGSKKFTKTATVKTTSYTNKKLATGQYYQYRVRAYYGKLVSAYSKTVTANTSISTPSISNVTSPKKKQAVVTWKKTKGVSGYQVYRATSKNGKYKK